MITDNENRWCKVDLHIHSKYSLEPRATMEIETIFRKAIENHIKLISITDHNNVDGLDEMLKISKKYEKEITFLPGIEFKTDKGDKSVHTLAIFPKNIPMNNTTTSVNNEFIKENITNKLGLTRVEIKEAGEGCYEKGIFDITVNFEDMSKLVHKWGGLVIVHATKANGFEDEMKHPGTNPTEYELLKSLGAKKRELMKDYIGV